MKKNFLNTLAAALLTGVVAVSGLTACSSDDNILGEQPATEQPATEQPAAVKTYHVSIHASFDGAQTRAVTFDGTTSNCFFTDDDYVIVRNATTGDLLLELDAETESIKGFLTITNLSEDGKSCDFEGDIVGTIKVDDVLELAYNLSEYFAYNYNLQNGRASNVIDAAVARLKVKAVDGEGNITFCQEDGTDDVTAHFVNQQSMFRLQFQDTDSNPIDVWELKISSKNDAIVIMYDILGEYGDKPYYFGPVTVDPNQPTSDYLYAAIKFDESKTDGDELTFTVTDVRGNVYECTKTAPAGGFKNGKYYYNSAPIQLAFKEKYPGPDIEWTSVAGIPRADGYNLFRVYGPWNEAKKSDDPSEISLSGTSTGYDFAMYYGSTVTLNGLTAEYDGPNYFFIYTATSGDDLNLIVNGTNNITCNSSLAIHVYGTLKLSGNGTLTVTVNNNKEFCGLYSSTNYSGGDPSALAADGYTVTRSDMTDNGDDTYTWTYTVAPNQ